MEEKWLVGVDSIPDNILGTYQPIRQSDGSTRMAYVTENLMFRAGQYLVRDEAGVLSFIEGPAPTEEALPWAPVEEPVAVPTEEPVVVIVDEVTPRGYFARVMVGRRERERELV